MAFLHSPILTLDFDSTSIDTMGFVIHAEWVQNLKKFWNLKNKHTFYFNLSPCSTALNHIPQTLILTLSEYNLGAGVGIRVAIKLR